jgi:ribosomal protein S6E (S10)
MKEKELHVQGPGFNPQERGRGKERNIKGEVVEFFYSRN